MKRILLTFTLASFTLASFAQLQFRGVSPAAVIGSYEFTYTSDPGAAEPWGEDLNTLNYELTGELILVQDNSLTEDSLGCVSAGNDLTGKIAVVYRGGCTFYNKIYFAQQRNAVGVVIINNVTGSPIGMSGDPALISNITIPAIQISMEDGALFRNYMEQGPVEVLLRDMQGYYNNNLTILKDFALIPEAASIPAVTAQNDSEFGVNLGTWVFNRGANIATNATLTGQVYYNGAMISDTVSLPETLNPGDTLLFDLGRFTMPTYSPGIYDLVYFVNIENTVDDDPFGDTLHFSFELTDSIYSLTNLDSNGLPIAQTYGTSGSDGLSSFKQCMVYQNANSDRLAASGLYFAIDDTVSVENVELEVIVHEWNDIYNPSTPGAADDFDSIPIISSTFYFMESDLRETMVYQPFQNDFLLNSNQKYLFCVSTSKPSIRIGYNSDVNYSLNETTFDKPAHPMRVTTNGNTNVWFTGFVSGIAPAFGLKTFDSAVLGISNIPDFKGNVFPNPVNNELTISLETSEAVANVNVIDITGKIVINKKVNLSNGTSKLNVENLEKGMYIINVSLNNGQSSIFNIVKR